MLMEVAGRFPELKSEAEKTSVAMDLFGRSGVELIPLLNKGQGAIRELMAEADSLGIVMSTDMAKRTKVFADKMTVIKEGLRGFQLENPQKFEYGYNVLRGIEVKVSRPDFKKGFVCSGCNYHYVLTPMRLVASYEVPKGIGLIEFNKYKFSCELKYDDYGVYEKRPYILKGIRVVKRPVFREIPQFQIDNVISIIAERFSKKDREQLFEEVSRKWGEGVLR